MQTKILNSKNKTSTDFFLLIIIVTYNLSGCQTSPQEKTHHPLTDKIWSVSEQAYISEDFLAANIINFDVMLLGETHDNAGHHQLQAQIIDNLVHQQRTPAIGQGGLYKMSPWG